MTRRKPTVEDSIKLALEAAEAANAVAADGERGAAEIAEASARVERIARRATLASGGVAALGLIAVALGGLMHLRSQADLRHASETMVEALDVFAGTVSDLRTAVQESQAILKAVETDPDAETRSAILARLDEMQVALGAHVSTELAGFEGDAALLQPQIASALTRHMDEIEERLQDGLLQNSEDMKAEVTALFAAQTDMLINRRAAAAPAPKTARETAAPATPAPTPRPARTTPPVRSVNPFVYP
ncbi:hypothetical protein EV663_105112 [Rhodovulum bhavnagarense]|uniref:Uncharacterized protein n=1 Tax=Rhodovulum bhavnagarense TaxID=992286 RepID=A0A4R2RFH1_9RHOB|nr:hypothetical protein [Rhodovulum bhavnagarense]TCP61394.1 hypothetical protein EV663_105112 [Rhodovulum bhavnagarense]